MRKNKPLYRIKETVFQHRTEFRVEWSTRLWGIHLFWDNTTRVYFDTFESAKKFAEDALGEKEEFVYYNDRNT